MKWIEDYIESELRRGHNKKRKSIRREIENENKNEWFGRTIRFYFSAQSHSFWLFAPPD